MLRELRMHHLEVLLFSNQTLLQLARKPVPERTLKCERGKFNRAGGRSLSSAYRKQKKTRLAFAWRSMLAVMPGDGEAVKFTAT